MQDSDTPCANKDLSELQNMVKSPRKHGDPATYPTSWAKQDLKAS